METQYRFRDHLIYWILPLLIVLKCIFIYFFNWYNASEIISPSVNREFGILENLQVLVLIATAFAAAGGAAFKQIKIEKYLFYLIALFSVIILLEEIDYGLHFYDLLTGREGDKKAFILAGDDKRRNIHSTGNNTSILKMTSYIIIGLLMIILPLLPERLKPKNSFLAYITPTRKVIFTAIVLVIINQIAFFIYGQNTHTNRSLDSNVSEFEELMFYYIILLYIWEMAGKKKRLPINFGKNTKPLFNNNIKN